MILAFDLDGTLLDDHQQIADSTIETIHQLQQQGMQIAVATGRSYSASKFYAKLIQADYVVSCNGALIIDNKNNEVLYKRPVPAETADAVLSLLYEHQDKLKIQWDSYDTYYTNNILPFEQEYVDAFQLRYPEETFQLEVVDTMEALKAARGSEKREIYQIFTFSMVKPPAEYEKILGQLDAFKDIQYVDFKTHYTDVTHKSVSKGKALDFLAQRHGYTHQEVMAFGDHHNDVSMLSYAGISVAMGNGEEDIKSLAKHVTTTNSEFGVERFLRKYFSM
jgi:hypothetical protein